MFGGIGSGMNSQNTNGHVHHVTECIREEKHKQPQGGAAASARMTAGESVQTITEQEPQWDLFEWVGRAIGRGTGGIRSLFGLGRGTGARDFREPAARENVAAQLLPDQKSGADRAVYFVPAREVTPQNSWFQNLKTRAAIRFGAIRGSLTKHLKQGQSLQTGTGKQGSASHREKQSRKRLSLYRQEDLEIECIITDDSYLLDSYNKKGDYSKLGSR